MPAKTGVALLTARYEPVGPEIFGRKSRYQVNRRNVVKDFLRVAAIRAYKEIEIRD